MKKRYLILIVIMAGLFVACESMPKTGWRIEKVSGPTYGKYKLSKEKYKNGYNPFYEDDIFHFAFGLKNKKLEIKITSKRDEDISIIWKDSFVQDKDGKPHVMVPIDGHKETITKVRRGRDFIGEFKVTNFDGNTFELEKNMSAYIMTRFNGKSAIYEFDIKDIKEGDLVEKPADKVDKVEK